MVIDERRHKSQRTFLRGNEGAGKSGYSLAVTNGHENFVKRQQKYKGLCYNFLSKANTHDYFL